MVQVAPLSSLISYTLDAIVLVNAAVNTVLLPAQIVADPVKVAVGTGAIVILTILLLTWLHTFNKSLTSARYHLSPTSVLSVVIVAAPGFPNEVQVT